jgi:hypothetical protein
VPAVAFPEDPFPDSPSLEHVRGQCRALQRAVRRGEPEALRRAAAQRVAVAAHPETFPLHAAQLVVAREYGFASWPRLRTHLVVAEHRWDAEPAAVDTAGGPPGEGGSPANGTLAAGGTFVQGGSLVQSGSLAEGGAIADGVADELCRLACLRYAGDDGPDRWRRAGELLAAHPALVDHGIWAAAAAADPDAVRAHLGADPTLARRRGGPYRWRPLFYLAYSRLEPAAPLDRVVLCARLLLEHGADPEEGYLYGGLPTPFTLLTGVFGEGEQGPGREPRHPHCEALARLLLRAGANPNDGQALYNRMFRPDDDHLRLLFEFGLGRGDGGIWKRRLGEALDSPAGMLRGQLGWAIDHNLLERVRLLVRHGVDIATTPFEDGRTPVARARLAANSEIADLLVAHGARPSVAEPVDDLVGAALSADRDAVSGLLAAHPGLADLARRRRPGLVVWAAAGGRRRAVELLAELGFAVSALGRGDAPVEQPWETALHRTAVTGDLELARVLLALGADPDIRDARFDSTPLGWARHFDQPALVALLEPVTAEETGE